MTIDFNNIKIEGITTNSFNIEWDSTEGGTSSIV